MWSFVLLFVVQVAVGLLIGQLVRPFLVDEEGWYNHFFVVALFVNAGILKKHSRTIRPFL